MSLEDDDDQDKVAGGGAVDGLSELMEPLEDLVRGFLKTDLEIYEMSDCYKFCNNLCYNKISATENILVHKSQP